MPTDISDTVTMGGPKPPFLVIVLRNANSEDSKATKLLSSQLVGKRKKGNFTEDEMLMLTNMSDVVNNVANALRETGLAHIDPDIYLIVMEMPRFLEEALIYAYSFPLDNKAQGKNFVGMSDSHMTLWLRTYLAKNYYM
jgi:hypothetical protein